MNIKDQAIAKITEECRDKEHLVPFEEYLTSICATDAIANKILNPKKTLEGAFEAMRKIAKKRAINGCAYIPPEEGFEIIRNYFEINLDEEEPEEVKDNVIDIMDLL